MPTAKGAIYACKFMQEAEVISTCADVSAQMNINTAHCLLGHRNEDSIRKTAKEMGWVLTRGVLKTCEHCAMAKAKQKMLERSR